MKIRCKNSGVKWVFNREISTKRIEFDEQGIAIVTENVGVALLGIYPDFVEEKSRVKTKKSTKEEDDA